jgi:proteic killer suppression protein
MAVEFRDKWLEEFYESDAGHRKIPASIKDALFRKLQLLDAATAEADLKAPSGNRLEHLQGNYAGWRSIRVNKKYRPRSTGSSSDGLRVPHWIHIWTLTHTEGKRA